MSGERLVPGVERVEAPAEDAGVERDADMAFGLGYRDGYRDGVEAVTRGLRRPDPIRCPYCGGPNPFWDDLDPRSWECTTCLAAAGENDPEAIR